MSLVAVELFRATPVTRCADILSNDAYDELSSSGGEFTYLCNQCTLHALNICLFHLMPDINVTTRLGFRVLLTFAITSAIYVAVKCTLCKHVRPPQRHCQTITTSLSDHHNITVRPSHHCQTITTSLSDHHNITFKPSQHHCQAITTSLSDHHNITVRPSQHHYQNITTSLSEHHNITVRPSQHHCQTIILIINNSICLRHTSRN